jgi:hypothetical protein
MRRLFKHYRVFGRYCNNRIEAMIYGDDAKRRVNTCFAVAIVFEVAYMTWQVMR